jgi:DNA-binding winged helix-turn-helix (wHTH) protein
MNPSNYGTVGVGARGGVLFRPCENPDRTIDRANSAQPGSETMKIAFGNCVLDLPARQLWREGKVVRLEPKMYELLEILIQRRPAVVTNEELDELLWPKVYVARTSLTRLVSELRTVLGDTPRDSKIIRTAYKKGYAFCMDVVPSEGSAAPGAIINILWKERLIPLHEGEHIAGRGTECSLVIDANSVSRRHARIRVVAGAATIEDLASTNGTEVDGMRIFQPTPIGNGSKVSLGSEMLIIRTYDPSALTVKTDRNHAQSPNSSKS